MINRRSLAGGAAALAATGAAVAAVGTHADAASNRIQFDMQRSPGIVAAQCLRHATAHVTVEHAGEVERMQVTASGLPKNTDFDLFVTQVPNGPFGVSWYQGDLESGAHGNAQRTYVGRFSEETFAVALDSTHAPSVHSSPTADATSNPPFAPIHTYHLGLWFNSPADAVAAGCPGATTPFNGEHDAGVQLLNTAQFGDLHGPLRRLKP